MRKTLIRQETVELLESNITPTNPTFRKAVGRNRMAIHVGSRNICEISTLLARGFWRYTDWAYWSVMTADPSWLCERHTWKLDYEDPDGREFKMMDDIVRESEVVHLSSYNTHAFLKRTESNLRGRAKMVIHHHGGRLRGHGEIADRELAAGYTVLVSTPDLLLTAPRATWLPSPISLEELDHTYFGWEADPSRFVVGHGYTIAENKGTYNFARAMSEVTRRGKIELLPWHGIRRPQSLWLMSQCDVYFASFLYGPGVGAYEAMAFGIPVLCGCSREELYWQREALGVERTDDLPWIFVESNTVADWVRMLATDPGLCAHWGAKGRAYVEEYHDVPKVVERLKAIYEAAEPCREVLWDV